MGSSAGEEGGKGVEEETAKSGSCEFLVVVTTQGHQGLHPTLTTERQPMPSTGIEYQDRKKEEINQTKAEKYQLKDADK